MNFHRKSPMRVLTAALMILLTAVLVSCSGLNPFVPPASSPESPSAAFRSTSTAAPTQPPTSSPQPSETPTPVTLEGCVKADSLRVRSGPGTEYEMIGGLLGGTCITLTGRNAETTWVQVQQDELTGWAAADYIAADAGLDMLAVVGQDGGNVENPGLAGETEDDQTPSPVQEADHVDHTAPSSAGSSEGFTTRTYPFEYGCQSYTLELGLQEDVYQYYSDLDRFVVSSGQTPGEHEAMYFTNFLQEGYDDQVIQDSLEKMRGMIEPSDNDQLALALTNLVQSLAYDCQKLYHYQHVDDHEYETNFPYETLYEQTGVCEDSSLLLADWLRELGYGTALLLYEENNHMAVGIRCPLDTAPYTDGGVGNCYIETTVPTRIGIKPASFDGRDFVESPQIIPVQEGSSFELMRSLAANREEEVSRYGEFVLQLTTCEEISAYKNIKDQEYALDQHELELADLEGRIDAKANRLNREINQYEEMECEGTLPQEKYDRCVARVDKIKNIRRSYNNLVDEYNGLLEEYNRTYQVYVRNFEAFEELLAASRASCAELSFGEMPAQEEGE